MEFFFLVRFNGDTNDSKDPMCIPTVLFQPVAIFIA